MPVFKFKALSKERQIAQGKVDAVSEDEAAKILQDKGFSIISIKKVTTAKRSIQLPFLNRVKIKDIAIFSRQFAVMISANVAMVQSLKILIEQTANIKLKAIISEIARDVDSGSKLSDALSKWPKIFSEFFVSIIRSGETSGKLDEVLRYLADEMEKDYDMVSKIRGAMMYPAFVLAGLFTVGTVMMIFVVPKLTAIFTETGAELPLTTRILISTSGFLSSYWWLVLIIIICSVVGFKFYVSRPFGRIQFDFLKLKIPVLGELMQRICIVRFTRSMHTLIIGGVTITNSLKIAGDVVSNKIYQRLITETIKEVEDGNSISSVFVRSKEVPKMVSQMMSIGETTGKLDVILDRLTKFYSREIDNVIANLVTLMEPIIMVIMGVAVGIMVAAIILPMYNLAGQF